MMDSLEIIAKCDLEYGSYIKRNDSLKDYE